MSNSLFTITAEYLEAFERVEVDEATGEILNLDALDALAGAFEEKAESVACYIKNLDAFVTSMKAEESNMAERRKAAERKIDNMKKYLSSCLDTAGRDKMETAKVRLSFRKSVQVDIQDTAAIPSEYTTQTVTTKADKTAIKKAIQGGADVPGAVLIENRNIQIK